MSKKYFVILAIALMVGITGCSNKSKTPDESSFSATITAPNSSKVNKDLVMGASLKNVSTEDYELTHAGGVFYFSVKDSQGKNVNQFVMTLPAIRSNLKSQDELREQYSHKLDTPGVYEISAIAKFSIGDEKKEYIINTNTMKVEVK
ncbi:hypothetical protein [Cohnella sp.]|uniref:hypothetical protein n=1 Tax=Cohnella sp. TaxID=1883426 RepID=UPI0035699A4F